MESEPKKQPLKVRRDIRSLKKAERERYFSCLRMLEILPPKEPKNLRTYYNVKRQIFENDRNGEPF